MNRKFISTRFPLYILNAGIIALLLTSFFPRSANAASHVSKQMKPTCMQAPANLDPTNLSEIQLESYGLPLRPANLADSQAQARWLQLANRIKHDHHDCNPQRVANPHNGHHHPSRPLNGQRTQQNFISAP